MPPSVKQKRDEGLAQPPADVSGSVARQIRAEPSTGQRPRPAIDVGARCCAAGPGVVWRVQTRQASCLPDVLSICYAVCLFFITQLA